MNNIETLLSELGRSLMRPEDLSYNGISEMQSSESYRMKIESLYSNAVSDLYDLNDSQREIAMSRIDEVRECQIYFDVPTRETVNSLLHDYNSQPEGKRNKSLLNDYRYCKFVLECVAIQKDYLERFASLLTTEKSVDIIPEAQTDTEHNTSKVEVLDDGWLSVDAVATKYGLPKNNIKSRKWRIEHDFPYKGFDEIKGAKNKVSFNPKDVEDWISNHKR